MCRFGWVGKSPVVCAAAAVACSALLGSAAASAAQPSLGWAAVARLVGPADRGGGTDFGNAVAVSSDGSTMVVGAQFAHSLAGAAYVYKNLDGSWTRQAVLRAADTAADDQFGYSVAISGDGSTIAVGAPGRHDYTGVAYLFADDGSRWAQTSELSASDSVPNSSFGQAVAVSGSGSEVVVGESYEPKAHGGAAFVYSDPGGSWKLVARLTDPNPEEGNFSEVALSSDGSEIVVATFVGGPLGGGDAHAFTGHRRTWTADGTIEASDTSYYDGFGASLALSADGSRIAIGAPQHHASNDLGAVYVFDHRGDGWDQIAEFAPTRPLGEAQADFGWSVGMSADGSLVVGGTTNNESRARAWAYTARHSAFHQSRVVAPRDSKSGPEGMSLAVSADGSNVYLGSDDAAHGRGAVYVMNRTVSQP